MLLKVRDWHAICKSNVATRCSKTKNILHLFCPFSVVFLSCVCKFQAPCLTRKICTGALNSRQNAYLKHINIIMPMSASVFSNSLELLSFPLFLHFFRFLKTFFTILPFSTLWNKKSGSWKVKKSIFSEFFLRGWKRMKKKQGKNLTLKKIDWIYSHRKKRLAAIKSVWIISAPGFAFVSNISFNFRVPQTKKGIHLVNAVKKNWSEKSLNVWIKDSHQPRSSLNHQSKHFNGKAYTGTE